MCKKSLFGLFIVFSVALASLGASTTIKGAQSQTPLEVNLETIELRRYRKSDAPVVVTFHNRSKQDVRILNAFGDVPVQIFFAFKLVDPNGVPVPNIRTAGKVELSSRPLSYLILRPGNEVRVITPMHSVLPQNLAPGNYEVSVIYRNQYGEDCFKGVVSSKSVKIRFQDAFDEENRESAITRHKRYGSSRGVEEQSSRGGAMRKVEPQEVNGRQTQQNIAISTAKAALDEKRIKYGTPPTIKGSADRWIVTFPPPAVPQRKDAITIGPGVLRVHLNRNTFQVEKIMMDPN